MNTDLFDSPAPVVEFDHLGRYLLPDPETGEKRAWTRVTTFAKSIADTYHLDRWKQRKVAEGLAARPDLLALVASADDKRELNGICDQAAEAAGASVGRNHGTHMHTLTEHADRGEDVTTTPENEADLAAYTKALAEAGLVVMDEYIERRVLIKKFGLVGTLDRILCDATGQLRVGDLKTAADINYASVETAVQLSCYARADYMWNAETSQWQAMPRGLDTGNPIVMHLPMGAGRCDLYQVDLEAGWAIADLCARVRSTRTRRDLLTPYRP